MEPILFAVDLNFQNVDTFSNGRDFYTLKGQSFLNGLSFSPENVKVTSFLHVEQVLDFKIGSDDLNFLKFLHYFGSTVSQSPDWIITLIRILPENQSF